MKTQLKPSKARGFTLIELLVVMTIIAVLAGAGFAGGGAAMNKARKVSSQAHAVSIVQAVEGFYNDYSALPDPGTNTTDQTFQCDTGNGTAVLNILSAQATAPVVTAQNPRLIKFLNAKEAKNPTSLVPKDGIVFAAGGGAVTNFVDAWGQPFSIVLDYDYNEVLVADGVTLRGRRVAVHSPGVAVGGRSTNATRVSTW